MIKNLRQNSSIMVNSKQYKLYRKSLGSGEISLIKKGEKANLALEDFEKIIIGHGMMKFMIEINQI